MRVASFNIEKNGASSVLEKKSQVETFINRCCSNKDWNADLLFLCEVHSAQIRNYATYLAEVYPSYRVSAFAGGHSNAYIVMANAFERIQICSQGHLLGLNRDLIAIEANSVKNYSGFIFLAHFKSGQNGLTKSQLKSCASLGGNWVVTGDMNLDYNNVGEVDTAGLAHECWKGQQTHAKGGILDWVLASADVKVTPVDLTDLAGEFDMSGPDHRPILFDITS